MRQRLGKKKLKKLSQLSGIDFIYGNIRGNTNHRYDLWDKEGGAYCYENILDEDDDYIKKDFVRYEKYDWKEIPEWISEKEIVDFLVTI